jgi:hypothetical protein
VTDPLYFADEIPTVKDAGDGRRESSSGDGGG